MQTNEHACSGRNQAVWGLLMIAFGTIVLLDRMDILAPAPGGTTGRWRWPWSAWSR